MGLSQKKTKSNSASTGTATTTPNLPSYLSDAASSYFGSVGGLVNQNPTGISRPASPLQTQAFNGASSLGGLNARLAEAMNGTSGLMSFQPQQVNAGQLSNTDLSPYTDPWENEVVSRSLADVDRMRQGAITGNQGAATMSGAFGGSRHGIADAETNRNYFDVAGNLAAGLRSQGFQNAQGAALTDIGNRLNADTFNSTQDLAGAGLRLGASNQLGSQALAGDDARRADLGLQAGLGSMQREIANENDPQQQRIEYLRLIQGLMGLDPSALIGQTINSSGRTSGSTTTSDPLGGIGTILQSIAALRGGGMTPSDRRLKTDAVLLGEDERGLRWWSYRYVWDDDDAEPHVGVMADEAPAHAVHMHPSGFLMVDYGAL